MRLHHAIGVVARATCFAAPIEIGDVIAVMDTGADDILRRDNLAENAEQVEARRKLRA